MAQLALENTTALAACCYHCRDRSYFVGRHRSISQRSYTPSFRFSRQRRQTTASLSAGVKRRLCPCPKGGSSLRRRPLCLATASSCGGASEDDPCCARASVRGLTDRRRGSPDLNASANSVASIARSTSAKSSTSRRVVRSSTRVSYFHSSPHTGVPELVAMVTMLLLLLLLHCQPGFLDAPTHKSGVLEYLHNTIARDLVGLSLKHGHFLVPEPRLLGERIGDVWVLVEVVAELIRILGLVQSIFYHRRMGQGSLF
uniref:Uncharacterized protein n=1 Tax=Anopheles farauti TaxID=69004 RepID=A0A182QPD1_9DIPT